MNPTSTNTSARARSGGSARSGGVRRTKHVVVRRMRISKEYGPAVKTTASMNRLVMDYLVGKGYREVAEAFWRDAGTKPLVDLETVQVRMSIQQLLLSGQIAKAREKLHLVDSMFLESNGSIDFLLAKQELIELIKAGQVLEALGFATKHLAPFGEKHPHFLQEIEHTMALLAFENQAQSPLGYLLQQAQRRRVADEVNSAILRTQKQELEPLLPTMVRQFHFMEDQLEIKVKRAPKGVQLPSKIVEEEMKEG